MDRFADARARLRSIALGAAPGAIVLAAVLLLGAGPVAAQGRPGFGPPGGGRPHHPGPPPPGGRPPRGGPPPLEGVLERHQDRLGLDAETRSRINEIALGSRARLDAYHQELRALHDEMRRLLAQEDPDEAAVLAQAEAIGRAEIEAHKEHLRAMLHVRALLTPEQRAELVKIREEEQARGGPGGRAFPGPPPGRRDE